MVTIVGFGEVMARISPIGHQAFGDSYQVQLTAGGSEANVLAKLGHLCPAFDPQLITALREGLLGRAIAADLAKYRVGTDFVQWTNEHRNGVYFLEQGLGPIVARVDYDRAGSAIANLPPHENWFAPLDEARAYFVSGISPALSDACRENTAISLRRAKRAKVPVFFDVNFRTKLWTAAQAKTTIERYLADGLITALITTETDARGVRHRPRRR
jgi:2-dehydro-3-deoxygluconokinase